MSRYAATAQRRLAQALPIAVLNMIKKRIFMFCMAFVVHCAEDEELPSGLCAASTSWQRGQFTRSYLAYLASSHPISAFSSHSCRGMSGNVSIV